MRREVSINLSRPSLIRIYNNCRLRGPRTHGFKAGHVIRGTQLNLQQRAKRMKGCLRFHRLRGVQRQRIGRDLRTRGLKARQLPNRISCTLGFQIPQRTIHSVARSSCRQKIIQIEPRKCIRQTQDFIGHRLKALAISGIGHTFAPANMLSVI